jgi:hypothetical protein
LHLSVFRGGLSKFIRACVLLLCVLFLYNLRPRLLCASPLPRATPCCCMLRVIVSLSMSSVTPKRTRNVIKVIVCQIHRPGPKDIRIVLLHSQIPSCTIIITTGIVSQSRSCHTPYVLIQHTRICQPNIYKRITCFVVNGRLIGSEIVTHPAVYDPGFICAFAAGLGAEVEDDAAGGCGS